MNKINSLCVTKEVTIKKVLEVIDNNKKQLALVIDNNKRLIGSITDGDIRRAILKNISLENSIEQIMNKHPKYINESFIEKDALLLMNKNNIHQLPVLDKEKRIIDLILLEDLISIEKKENWVILMLGGLGTRLSPLTDNTPKPMLEIGGKPIVKTIVDELVKQGFYKFVFCLNYLGYQIEEYFGNGEEFGIKVEYIHENKRLGTAGALALINQISHEEDFIVMNGDLLTKTNFGLMLSFHIESKATATMGVREYDYQIPFGVIRFEEGKILEIKEKPSKKEFVSGGIYILNSEILKYIPKDEFFDMPTLFEKIIVDENKTCVFPIREYWKDVGRIEDFESANIEYNEIFK